MPAQHRTWLMLRKLDEQKSLFFTLTIRIEEDEPALFGAVVSGLDNRMAAVGDSLDEAERNALDMFMALVNHAIETRTPLGFELGPTIPAIVVPVTLEDADKFFDAVTSVLKVTERPEEAWRSVPTSLLVASTMPLSVGS